MLVLRSGTDTIILPDAPARLENKPYSQFRYLGIDETGMSQWEETLQYVGLFVAVVPFDELDPEIQGAISQFMMERI